MSNEDYATDLAYKLLAASGFMLDAFREVERLNLKSPLFTMSLKNSAQKFRDQLVRSEAIVTATPEQGRNALLDQMVESYHLAGRLFDIQLQAGRKLPAEVQVILSDEISAVVKKYGIILPA